MACVVLLVDFHFQLADVIGIGNDEVLHVIMEISSSTHGEHILGCNVLVKLILRSIVVEDQNVVVRGGNEKVISIASKV